MRKLRIEELNRLSVDEFKSTKKNTIVLILDSIRSRLNVGSILRTCDAFLIEKVYLTGITPRPPHREIRKTALGAEDSMDWAFTDDIIPVVSKLRSDGYSILSVEQADNSIPLKSFQKTGRKYVLIFGNEVEGVSEELIAVSDAAIEIPQFGTKHSLNVAVAAGIILYDFTVNLPQ
jgi:tRNA G18 (ribose-2'-O)-methylase SpoU